MRRSTQIRATQRTLCDTEDVVHHAGRERARVRVLTARVIAADERLAVRQLMRDAVAECRTRPNGDALLLQQLQIRVERDLSQPDDDADARECGDLGVEMRPAVEDLFRRRLVRRRRAARGDRKSVV